MPETEEATKLTVQKTHGAYKCPDCGATEGRHGDRFTNYFKLLMHRVRMHQYKMNDKERNLWGSYHHPKQPRGKKPDYKKLEGRRRQRQIDPASDGPWTCPACALSFPTWIGIARHGRLTQHWTLTPEMRGMRKQYVDAKFHAANPNYGSNGAAVKPKRVTHARNQFAVMPYQEGFLILVPSENGEAPRTYYGFPVTLKFDMPKPRV